MDNNPYSDFDFLDEDFAKIRIDKPTGKEIVKLESVLKNALHNLHLMHPRITPDYLGSLMDPVRRSFLNRKKLEPAIWIPCGNTISGKGKAYSRGGFFCGQYITLRAPRYNKLLSAYKGNDDKKILGPVVDLRVGTDMDPEGMEANTLPFSTFYEMPESLQQDLLAYLACEKEITDLPYSLMGYILSGFQIRLFNQIAIMSPSKIQAASHDIAGILDRLLEFHKQFRILLNENPKNPTIKELLRVIDKLIVFTIGYFKIKISPGELGIEVRNNRSWRVEMLKKIMPKGAQLYQLPDETLEQVIDLYDIPWALDEKFLQVVRNSLKITLREKVSFKIPNWGLDAYETFEFPHRVSNYFPSGAINDYCSVSIPLDIEFLRIDEHIESSIWRMEFDFKPYMDIGNPLLKPLALPPYVPRTEEETETIYKTIFGDTKGDYVTITFADLVKKFDFPEYYQPTNSLWFLAETLLPRARMTLAPLPDYDNVKADFDTPIIITRTDEDLSKNISNTPNVKARTIARVVGLILYGTQFGDYEMEVAEEFLATSRVSKRNMVHWKAMLRFYPLKKSSFVAALKNNIKEKFKSPADAQQFRDFVVRLVWNGKEVDNKRLKMAEKLFPVLGLDPTTIHGDLHRLLTSGAPKSTKKGGTKKFSIDKKTLRQIEESTREVQDKLQEIFSQDDPKEKRQSRNKKKPAVVNDISEPAYMQILRKLVEKEEWPRAEAEKICKEHGMLLNTALEAINDYAYEKYDDALVEDNDEIINVYPEIMQ